MMEGECSLSGEGKAGTDLDAICSCFAAWSTWCTLWVVTGALALILVVLHSARKWLLRKFEWLKTFYVWIGVLAVLGGAWAFLFPLAINADFSKTGDGAALRQTLIYTTGGLLGVITLGETRHKNDQEHMRQVHSERRSRYATAIEQLADEKAPIRLGGVYTLVKLVDEWLADEKTLPNEEERREEGQVIINSLCAYIRSSFDLASKAEMLSQDKALEDYEGGTQQFAKDQARFREEKELRLTILNAIKTRLNSGTIIQEKGTEKILKGPWSDFDYDFSGAVFFYSIGFTNSYFGASSNFSGVEFTEKAEFSEAKFFQDADFSGVKLTEASFFKAEFTKASFSRAEFTQNADFYGAKFTQNANFYEAKFTQNAKFSWGKFTQNADFSGAAFTNVDFSGAAFTQNANFYRGKFTKNASFFKAEFTEAIFSKAEFTKYAGFSKAKFTSANFSEAEFTRDADFSKAKFTVSADFSKAFFEEKPKFEYALGNKTYKARFSCKANPKGYNFEVSPDSPYKIETKEQEHNGIKFVIPEDAELFDPDEPSEQGNNDGN